MSIGISNKSNVDILEEKKGEINYGNVNLIRKKTYLNK